MKHFDVVYQYLNNRPHIGVIGGMSSGFFYFIKDVFFNDNILKLMSGVGVYLGVAVAFISLLAKVLEIRKHFKKTQE